MIDRPYSLVYAGTAGADLSERELRRWPVRVATATPRMFAPDRCAC
ncbi:hypothetical protein [Kineosporia mesophila]|nr:hypothetical protein [Kineosporia mesophila]MCD5354278.1 hypothetical protein [Kineosporia mesophila]